MRPAVNYSLYLVTDSELMSADTVEQSVEQAIKGGCTLVQLREKEKSSLDFYNTAVRVKAVCASYGVPLIVNDRIDIALAVDADGVHIGQEDLPAKIARKLIGDDKILGVSASSLDEALQAQKDGADYIGVGAMFATGTKKDAKPVSIGELKEIRSKVRLPLVVIGGINKNTVPLFSGTGIDGIAVVSAIVSADDIEAAARGLKALFLKNAAVEKLDFKAAIFDLDGTLIDSMRIWEKIDVDFLSKRNLSVPDGYIDAISALSFRDAAEYTIGLFGLDDSVQDLIDEWNDMAAYEYGHNIKLKPGAKEYLLKLKASGIKLATATSLPELLYGPVLKNNGVYDLFDIQCSTDEVNRGKEYPDVFLLAAEKLGVPPEDCAVFEDLLPGIISAKAAGMTAVGVYDEYSEKQAGEIGEVSDGYLYDFENAPVPVQ